MFRNVSNIQKLKISIAFDANVARRKEYPRGSYNWVDGTRIAILPSINCDKLNTVAVYLGKLGEVFWC